MILRASNAKSVHIYKAMGATILSEGVVEIKGEKCELKLMNLAFDNPVFQKMIGLWVDVYLGIIDY